MKLALTIKDWLSSFLSLWFPRCCVTCGRPLAKGEECICSLCNIHLPRTNYQLQKDNSIERMFWGKIPIERASSFFFYRKGSNFRQILHQLKYGGQKQIGVIMGRQLASEMLDSGFFNGIDLIIPVPLHKRKQQMRGYNQSEWLARGVSAVIGIPVNTDSLVRISNTESQTHKSVSGRWENVEGQFRPIHTDRLVGKHVLIMDDVLTTGATILACASCLADIQRIKISVLTLAVAE